MAKQKNKGEIDLTGWDKLPPPVDSLDGQQMLFGDTKRKQDTPPREWKDRKRGQTFLFDEEENQDDE